jgi:HEAT repeat protein
VTLSTGAAANTPTGDTDQPELPFPPAPIEELLRLLVKAVRTHQLYLPNNPVYKGAIESVRAAFAPIWQQTDECALKFTETEVQWFGRPVLTETTKSADSLPWTFFKDGIREIKLCPGFEQEELVKFFEILQRVRNASPDEDDLLTMLWESDFANLRYRYVDFAAEAVPPLDVDAANAEPSANQLDASARAETDESRANVVNMQDFDATLYFLDEKELDYLKHEIAREYQDDLRRNVIAILFDIYEAQTAPAIRDELTDLIEHVMLLMLSAGQLRSVAYLLAETQVAVQRAADVTPAQRERLGRLPDRLSTPEPLAQLLQALDEAADLPSQSELTEVFEQLRPSALGTIFSWLPRLQNAQIRALVEQSASRLAAANTAELVKLVLSNDRVVSAEAIRRAGAMKTSSATVPMARVLHDGEVALRQLAVQALTDIGSAGALQALERSIEDKDRDVRIAAVRALGARAHKGVFSRLEPVVKGKNLRAADLTEKMAFFEAYGGMCGDNGVPYLDGILNGKGMFGKREDPELRACAAMALGRVGTKTAQECLARAAGEKDVIVRNAVSRALRAGAA